MTSEQENMLESPYQGTGLPPASPSQFAVFHTVDQYWKCNSLSAALLKHPEQAAWFKVVRFDSISVIDSSVSHADELFVKLFPSGILSGGIVVDITLLNNDNMRFARPTRNDILAGLTLIVEGVSRDTLTPYLLHRGDIPQSAVMS